MNLDAILETDQVGTLFGDRRHRRRSELAIGAVVDDDAEPCGFADRGDMSLQAGL